MKIQCQVAGNKQEISWAGSLHLIDHTCSQMPSSAFYSCSSESWSSSKSMSSGCCCKPLAIPNCCFQAHHCCLTSFPGGRYAFSRDRLVTKNLRAEQHKCLHVITYCANAKLRFSQRQQSQKEPDGDMNRLKLMTLRDRYNRVQHQVVSLVKFTNKCLKK